MNTRLSKYWLHSRVVIATPTSLADLYFNKYEPILMAHVFILLYRDVGFSHGRRTECPKDSWANDRKQKSSKTHY